MGDLKPKTLTYKLELNKHSLLHMKLGYTSTYQSNTQNRGQTLKKKKKKN